MEEGHKERCGSRVPQIKSSWADSGQCPQNHNNITGSANLNCMCVNTSSCPHMKGKSFIRGAVSITHQIPHQPIIKLTFCVVFVGLGAIELESLRCVKVKATKSTQDTARVQLTSITYIFYTPQPAECGWRQG